MSNDWEIAMKRDSDGAAWWWCHGVVCGLGFATVRIEEGRGLGLVERWEKGTISKGRPERLQEKRKGRVLRERERERCAGTIAEEKRKGFSWKRKGTVDTRTTGTIAIEEKGKGFTWKRKGTVRWNDCRRERKGRVLRERERKRLIRGLIF